MRRSPRRLLLLAVLGVAAALTAAGCSAGTGTPAAQERPGTTEPAYKVTVAGDSISVGLGAALRDHVPADEVVKVIGVEGTGLARPDTFDWPGRLAQLAKDFPPQVLIFSLGSNDAQDLTDANGKVVARFADQAAWDAEYRRRLAAAFDAFRPGTGTGGSAGTRVVWAGHVRTADDKVGLTNRRIHRLAAEVATDRPWVTVTDLATLLGTNEDKATRCLIADGLHLSRPCLDEAAGALQTTVLASLRAGGGQ